MLNLIDMIYVLKLKKNDATKLEKNVREIFPNIKIKFYEVDGISNKNEGNINQSLFEIIKHNTINEVALDITKNHIEIIKEAYNNNYNNILFLEEDVIFENPSQKKMENVDIWLTNNKKWDIFYLGYCNWPVMCSFFITSNIIKVTNPLLTHAYILNKQGIEKILNFTENGKKNMNMHIDKLFIKIPNFNKYAVYPLLAYQEKNAALFTKACDKLNLNLSMKTICKISQYISLLFPIIFIFLLVFILYKIFIR